MKKHLFLLAAAALLLPTASHAAFNVIVNSNGGPMYAGATGSLLSGSLVRVGSAPGSTPAQIATAAATAAATADFTAFEAMFTFFGEDGGTTDDGSFVQGGNPVPALTINDVSSAGHIGAATVQNVDQAYAGGNGTRLYTVVYNVTPANQASATQFGVFSANEATWTVPALGAANLSTNQINEAGEVLYGTLDTTNNQLRLGPIVPEPTVTALIGLSGLGLLLRRRR